MTFTKDPSTHPANGPLTEERLIRVRDELQRKLEYGRDLFFADAVKAIDELLSVWKAGQEPVAKAHELSKVICHFRDWNEGFPVDRFKADYVISWMLENYPPAPQLPQPAVMSTDLLEGFEDWYSRGREDGDTIAPEWFSQALKPVFEDTWKYCRAAMLHGADPLQGWIPCSERMPERDYVLAADFSGAYYLPSLPNTQVGIYADWFADGNPSWDDGDGNDLHLKQVTHWMPLPAAPQQEAEPVQAAPEGWVPCSPEWIERYGPCSCAEAPRIAFGSIGNHYHPHIYHNPKHEERP